MKYIIIAFALTSCTKTYTAPAFWDVKIQRSADTLTAVAYSTGGKVTEYKWTVNDKNLTGNRVILSPGRNTIQLTAFDDKGNSSPSEYETFVK